MSAKPISKQRQYQLRRIKKGLCSICGKNPLALGERCKDCTKKHRKVSRKSKGCKAWKSGGRGRPPKELK